MDIQKIARQLTVNQRTASRVLIRSKEDLVITRKSGSGRKKGIGNQKTKNKIVSILQENPNISGSKLAQKVEYSEFFVRKAKKEAGLKTFEVKKFLTKIAVKNTETKQRAKKLKTDFFEKFDCYIMGDKTYVSADFSQLPGQEFYTADSRGNVEEKFKSKRHLKFPCKLLVWQAICSCGERRNFLQAWEQ